MICFSIVAVGWNDALLPFLLAYLYFVRKQFCRFSKENRILIPTNKWFISIPDCFLVSYLSINASNTCQYIKIYLLKMP